MTGPLLAGGIFLLDEKLKEHVDSTRLQGSKKEILGGRLILRNCHNEGTAFGVVKLGKEECQEMSAIALGAVLGESLRQMVHGGHKIGKIGLSMILGGGLSNYVDRCRRGYVTDYVSFASKNKKLEKMVFNLSDFCILGGTLLWAVSACIPDKQKKKTEKRKTDKKKKG